MSNIFSILIATDCHLGYEETDPIIGEDSFIVFEEILIKAVEEDVDLILLGGDLFHHNNPSQKCMNKCMALLRRYTLGDKPVYFELLCNASEVLSNPLSETTNYLDDNINVSIPVFSIHGNHDDPSGLDQFSALDTLSSAGLVNYFGKWTDLNQIVIKPILLRKGTTKIALYGLSHIKDDRLCRLFINNKVKFLRPENEPDDWFNIFVLHQNRVDRGPKRFVSESQIPAFIDLVIWGHEHDCIIEPVQNMEKGFYVMQPGSSVPTSLSEGEAIPKHIALLKVHEKKMKVKPLKLNTARPFIWRTEKLWDVVVSSEEREKKSEEIKTHCMQIIEEMIRESKSLLTGHIKQPKIPLVRLRCEYDDETQLFNVVKFGQNFLGRVATPYGEIIRLKKCFTKTVKKEKSQDLARLNELYKEDMEEAQSFTACVNHIVQDYFTNHADAKMMVLRVKDMGMAVEKFIEKDDMFAIEDHVDKRFKKMVKELLEQKLNVEETDLKKVFEEMRDEDEKTEKAEESDLEKKMEKLKPNKGKVVEAETVEQNYTENEDMEINSDDSFGLEKEKTGKQKTGKSASASDSDTDDYDVEKVRQSSSRYNARSKDSSSDDDMFGKSKRKEHSIMDDYDDRSDEETTKTRGRGRGGRGRARGRGKTTETSRKPSPRSSQPTPRGGKTRQPLKFTNSIVYESDSD